MNTVVHFQNAHQRHLDTLRESSRRHPIADVPPRERRLSRYGARLAGLVRPLESRYPSRSTA